MMSIHIPKHNVLMYIEISEIEWLDLYIFKRHLVNRVYSTYITKIDLGLYLITSLNSEVSTGDKPLDD